MAANPKAWVKCLDCGARELVRRSVLGRRTRYRCGQCGGPVEPSQKATNDLARGMDARRKQVEKRSANV